MNHSLSVVDAAMEVPSIATRAIELLWQFATVLWTLVMPPLLLLTGVQFAVQFIVSVRREANRLQQRQREALNQDRRRLIEEIKQDLLKTLCGDERQPLAAKEWRPQQHHQRPTNDSVIDGSSATKQATATVPIVRRTATVASNGAATATAAAATATATQSSKGVQLSSARSGGVDTQVRQPGSRRLEQKECSNIVNEIIYQIQSGSRKALNSAASVSSENAKQPSAKGDLAILRDVNKRNVVARMKTLFEQPPPAGGGTAGNNGHRFMQQRAQEQAMPSATPRQLSNVVNTMLRRSTTATTGSTVLRFSSSLENLRSGSISNGGAIRQVPFVKGSSEPPPGVVRVRRRIRSQHSLSESIENILEAERLSKRLSQYSISDLLLDEDDDDEREEEYARDARSQPYDRVARGLKTLSTFSLSELLQDDDDDDDVNDVILRRKPNPAVSPAKPSELVDNIEQILIAENLADDYWKYSISNLLDLVEDCDDGREQRMAGNDISHQPDKVDAAMVGRVKGVVQLGR